MDIISEGSTGLPQEPSGVADNERGAALPVYTTGPSRTNQAKGNMISDCPPDLNEQATEIHQDKTMSGGDAPAAPKVLPNDSQVVHETSRVPGLPSETLLESSYFSAAIPHGVTTSSLASFIASSNVSSPVQSASSSSHSLINSGTGASPITDGNNSHAQLFRPRAAPSLSTQPVNASRTPPTPRINSSASAPTFTRLNATHNRQDTPRFSDQSFVALQSQHNPPQSHPLRTRSSHPSPNSFFTTSLSRTAQDHSSMSSGSRTAGNTPAQSPGIFPSDNSRNDASGESDESRYSVPLQSTHLQAPKE